MFTLLAGLTAGFIHVLSGPDHLAAVAPLAVTKPHGSWIAGFRWGMGHTAGVAAVGALSLLLRGWLPVDAISDSSERFVGVLLIGIGAWALRKALQVHSHPHAHDDAHEAHEHIHIHGKRQPHEQAAHIHTHAAFGIGTLHGLAGSSHFLGILPALALPSTALATSYLISFGVGTIAAMVLFSHVIGALASRFQLRMWKAYRALMFASAGMAMMVGVAWLTGFSF